MIYKAPTGGFVDSILISEMQLCKCFIMSTLFKIPNLALVGEQAFDNMRQETYLPINSPTVAFEMLCLNLDICLCLWW